MHRTLSAKSQGTTEAANRFAMRRMVKAILSPLNRGAVFEELCKNRNNFSGIGIAIWHEPGALGVLLQEIITVYPLLDPPTLTAQASKRVCNALALLQCVADDARSRDFLVATSIIDYIGPLMDTVKLSSKRPFEFLRLAAMGVIGSLAKSGSEEVVRGILSSEIIKYCMELMQNGSESAKTLSAFIVQKITGTDVGRSYVCETLDRIDVTLSILESLVGYLRRTSKGRLLKIVIVCYLNLSNDTRAFYFIRRRIPMELVDKTFTSLLDEDEIMKQRLVKLLTKIHRANALDVQIVSEGRMWSKTTQD